MFRVVLWIQCWFITSKLNKNRIRNMFLRILGQKVKENLSNIFKILETKRKFHFRKSIFTKKCKGKLLPLIFSISNKINFFVSYFQALISNSLTKTFLLLSWNTRSLNFLGLPIFLFFQNFRHFSKLIFFSSYFFGARNLPNHSHEISETIVRNSW